MTGRRCLAPGCSRGRAQGHAMCPTCWASIPKPVRDAYWATRPHSNERRAALLDIFRQLARP